MLRYKYLYLFLIQTAVLLMPTVTAQDQFWDCSSPMKYENRNQVDPPALKVSTISGQVTDQSTEVIAGACIGIFRESDKKLIKTVETNASGRFKIVGIRSGRYRLVVRVAGFCSANTRLIVGRGRKSIVVHMRAPAIDTCSYSDYRK